MVKLRVTKEQIKGLPICSPGETIVTLGDMSDPEIQNVFKAISDRRLYNIQTIVDPESGQILCFKGPREEMERAMSAISVLLTELRTAKKRHGCLVPSGSTQGKDAHTPPQW